MGPEPFAMVDDYEARYGDAADRAALRAALGDATAYIASLPGFSLIPEGEPGCGLQRANLVRVTCAAARRSLTAGDLAGVTQYSQGAAGITASVSLSNPNGDIYLTRAERQSLGLGGGRVGATDPFGGGRDAL